MATPSYNAQPKFNFIDSTVTDLSANAILLQKDVLEKLNAFLTEFDIKDGRFIDSDRATRVLNDIDEEIKKVIAKSKYRADVLGFARDYGEIEKFNQRAQKTLSDIVVSSKDIDAFRASQIKLTISQLVEQGVDVNFTQPLTQALMNNILLGSTLSDTRDYLRTYTMGDAKKEGVLQRYSTQIARGLLYGYDGKVNQQIQIEYELNAFMYVGSLVQDSRGQCVRWVGMRTLMVEDLQSEIDLAYANAGKKIDGHRWGGMTPGTTPDNFSVNCGGHDRNCRHSAIPYRLN